MFDKVLPIGTIVLLKGATKRLMIIGYCKYKSGDMNKIYDYAGCIYPEGYLSPDTAALFDHEQIDTIVSLGFRNMAQYEFQLKLEKALADMEAEKKESTRENEDE